MSTPIIAPTNPSTPATKSEWLTRLASSGAYAVALLYGIGFVIVSLHHWTYGILVQDLLRPRVFATAVLFLLFVAIPVVGISRVFHLFGLRKHGALKIHVIPENEKYLDFCIGCDFYFISYGLAGGFSGLVLDSKSVFATNRSGIYLLALMSLFVLNSLLESKSINERPLLCCCSSALTLVAGAYCIWRDANRDLFWLVAWVYVVGIAFLFIKSAMAEHSSWKSVPFEYWLPVLVLLLTAFTKLYGKLSPGVGGGALSPVTVYFSKSNPLCGAQVCKLSLIDETDRGLYVVAPTAKKAFYVRRDEVEAIHYEQ